MSLYSNLYRYKQKESKNEHENYLTEIFAYVLQYDCEFRDSFLKEFTEFYTDKKYTIKVEPQNICKEGSDIIMEALDSDDGTPVWIIWIENKVDSQEGWRIKDGVPISQLDIYDENLYSQEVAKEQKLLVYLTRKAETIDCERFKSNFKQIYWHQIYNRLLKNIEENRLNITYQFKLYLISMGMNTDRQFTLNDVLALKSIGKLIKNLDEVLDKSKEVAKEKLEIEFNGNAIISRTRFLRDNDEYAESTKQGKINFIFGFSPGHDGYLPNAYVWLECSDKTNENWKILCELMKNKEWEIEEDNSVLYIVKYLTELLHEEGDHIEILCDFFSKSIESLAKNKEYLKRLMACNTQ